MIITFVLALFFDSIFFFPGLVPQEVFSRNDSFNTSELELLREGDILLQAGTGLVCDTIIFALHEDAALTHSAIVLRGESGWLLAHSVNSSMGGIDGVHTVTLETMFRNTRPDSLILVRPKISDGGRARFIDAARRAVAQAVPFDNLYNLADSTAYYCSEFVVHALYESGMPGLKEALVFQGPFLGFATFLNPALFEPILSHHPGFQVTPVAGSLLRD